MKEYSKGIYVKFKPEEVEILHLSFQGSQRTRVRIELHKRKCTLSWAERIFKMDVLKEEHKFIAKKK